MVKLNVERRMSNVECRMSNVECRMSNVESLETGCISILSSPSPVPIAIERIENPFEVFHRKKIVA